MRLEDADGAIVSAVAHDLLDPAILEAAAARAAARVASPSLDVDTRRRALQTALGHADTALARLTQAVAEGGALATLVQAVRDQERRHQPIRAELADLERPRAPAPTALQLHTLLHSKAEEWQGLLRKHAPIARQMIRKLLNGRIVFTPDREARRLHLQGAGQPDELFQRNCLSTSGGVPKAT